MKLKIKKDKDLRKRFLKLEPRQKFFKAMHHNMYLENSIRGVCFAKETKFRGLGVKFVNRCVVTGRSKGVLREFKISRMVFKRLSAKGELVGVRKSSW